jgi:ribosomal protein L40E
MDNISKPDEPLNAFPGVQGSGDFPFASSQGHDVAEIDRLRVEIQFLNAEINTFKSAIGEYYWQLFLESGRRESSLNDIFDGIRSREDRIAAMEQDIMIAEDGLAQPIQPPVRIIAGLVACKSCGGTNDASAELCSSCGMKMTAETGAEADYSSDDCGICPLCGANLQEDAIFCYTCGARIKI